MADVRRQESFWRLPLWPIAFDGVQLLTHVALATPTSLTRDEPSERLLAHLAPSL